MQLQNHNDALKASATIYKNALKYSLKEIGDLNKENALRQGRKIRKRTYENTRKKNGLVCCGILGVLAIATLTFYSGILDPIINFIGNRIGQ